MESNGSAIFGSIVIPIVVAAITFFLQWPSYKLAKVQLAEKTGDSLHHVEFEWKVPLWVQRAASFLVNFIATYFLVQEYSSTEPVTRASVVFIASMAGLFTASFLIPFIMGVYQALESASRPNR